MKSLEMKRILLLGGITEALAIARTLGPQHIYSLAGIGRVPTDLTCQVGGDCLLYTSPSPRDS